MLAIKTSNQLLTPLRQISVSRRFISGDIQSRVDGAKLDSNSKKDKADRMPSGDDIKAVASFQSGEDLHGVGLDEMSVTGIKSSLFKKEDLQPETKNMDWTKGEKKVYEHPLRATIDRIADGVEHGRVSESSKSFAASKETTDRAAHFSDAQSAARTGESVRRGVEGAKSTMSDVGKRVASMTGADKLTGESIANSVNDVEGPNAYRSSESGMESQPSMMENLKDSAKHGMDKVTEKMSDMGQSLAGSMKGMEGLADSMSHMSMPKSVSKAAETIKEVMPTKDSLKESAESMKEAMPSVESLKQSAQSLKDSVMEKVSSASESLKESMPSKDSIKGAAKSVSSSMPSTESIKESMPSVESIKESMPSTDSIKGMAKSVSSSMPSTSDIKRSASDLKDNLSSKMSDAKDTANAVAESTSGVFDSFRSGMATMKEAMKPVVDYASEKIPPMAQSIKENLKAGASVAAEKIPPLAQSIKEKASDMLHSETAESIKESVSSSARGAYVKAKETASTIMTGPKDSDKMEIKENTKFVGDKQAKAKDQEMSSSDIFKP